MSLESPSQEKLLTPEVLEILKKRYEQAKKELLRENMEAMDEVGKIKSPNLQILVKSRLGLIPINVAGVDLKLREVEVSLN